MLAWHFSNGTKLGYRDGREIKLGEKLTVEGPIELCERGLHASVRALDALRYAPGPVLWRVELSGTVIEGDDKCVATERTPIAGGTDASGMLRKFARLCALDVIHLWDAPPVVRDYLETGDESLRLAAQYAAWDAARAERDAAWAAAYAARAAAYATAQDAAWDAAQDAAWAAGYATAYAAEAAQDAAWDAAQVSAQEAQATRLEEMCLEFVK